MSTQDQTLDNVQGSEALTIGEKLVSLFKEVSLGIDAFNAKNFNKSIHTVDGVDVWKKLSDQNAYFSVSIKHIPAPVFFNAQKISFKDYVELVLKAVPLIKLVSSQADQMYQGVKKAAVTGQVPYSIRNVDNVVMINQARETYENVVSDTGVYTRAVNELYTSFGEAYTIGTNFNSVVRTLQSRDVEILAKRVDQVLYIVKLLKDKVDSNEIILDAKASQLLNDSIEELVNNVTFAGKMISLLSDLTRVLQLQIQESTKLK